MPIRFRCSYCNRLLGIATRKAGMETTCPHCGYTITVPVPQEENDRTERMNFEDVEAALGRGATEMVQPPAAIADPPAVERPRADPPKAALPAPPPVKPKAPPLPPPPAPKPVSANPNERPLFERDMDDILGKTKVPVEPEKGKPKAVSGMDAMSLGEPTQGIVLSQQKATFLMILVVVLIVLSFVAGYFVAGG